MAKKKPTTKRSVGAQAIVLPPSDASAPSTVPTLSAGGSSPQATRGSQLRTTTSTPVVRRPIVTSNPRVTPQTPVRAPANPSVAQAAPATSSMDPQTQQAVQIAMSQLQPQIDSVNQQQQQGQAAHNTRVGEINDWANWQQGNLNSAFNDTTNAVNNLITLQGGVDSANRDALAAALRSGASSTDQAAAQLGVASPTDMSKGLLAVSESQKSNEMNTGQGAANLIGFMGANRTLGSVGQAQNQEQERQRWNAENQGYTKSKNDLTAQVPGLVTASLQDLRAYQLQKDQFGETKANDQFQQYLADKQLNLQSRDQTFQQWLAKQQLNETVRSNRANESITATQNANQNAIDWANVGINRTQAEGQLAQIRADAAKERDTNKRAQIEARGAAMSKALTWLSSYMAPTNGEASPSNGKYPYGAGAAATTPLATDDPNTPQDETKIKATPATRTYQRLFDDALRGMLNYTTRSDALRILMKSDYPDWRKKARAEYNRLKRRKQGYGNLDSRLSSGLKNNSLPSLTSTPQK